jgi:hypothetical protein
VSRGNAQHGAVVADAGNQSTGQPTNQRRPSAGPAADLLNQLFFTQGHADPNIPR